MIETEEDRETINGSIEKVIEEILSKISNKSLREVRIRVVNDDGQTPLKFAIKLRKRLNKYSKKKISIKTVFLLTMFYSPKSAEFSIRSLSYYSKEKVWLSGSSDTTMSEYAFFDVSDDITSFRVNVI